MKIVLPDEISGDRGDDFSPLDVTTAGEASYRAHFVAKKTWQIASACEEMRYVEVNDSLSRRSMAARSWSYTTRT